MKTCIKDSCVFNIVCGLSVPRRLVHRIGESVCSLEDYGCRSIAVLNYSSLVEHGSGRGGDGGADVAARE